jgi:ribonuclease VapC
MMFVDASAMIAMIAGEPDAAELADRLESESMRLCSAVSIWETVAGLCRTYTFSVDSARQTVRSFLPVHGFQYVSIGEREFEIATDAYAQFGKGRHPAALNMGDCYAYACAKANRAKLLFKGNDFSKTDIPAAG